MTQQAKFVGLVVIGFIILLTTVILLENYSAINILPDKVVIDTLLQDTIIKQDSL